MFEAWIPADGRSVEYVPDPSADPESVAGVLLGATISYVLVLRGSEPLHATVVERDGIAFGLLGDSGYGKSTLAAHLIAFGGCRLVTDDLLVILDPAEPRAELGLPRLKLEPPIAQRYFGRRGAPYAPTSAKMLIPMDDASVRHPVPLAMLALLPAPDVPDVDSLTIRECAQSESFIALTKNTFNSVLVDQARLRRQFAFAETLSSSIPILELAYQRRLEDVGEVAEALLDHAATS